MPAITPTDLNNAKTDVDKISEFMESSSLTMTTRLGATIPTRAGLADQFPNAEPAAAAAAASETAAAASAIAAAASATASQTAREASEDAQALSETARVGAELARDQTLGNRGLFATTAKALSKGVTGYASLVAGSGGTNGTFDLAFSGGAGSGAAGRFVVAGGAVVSITITAPGDSYTSAPTISFAASSGLTGASATAVIANNSDPGEYFWIPSSSSIYTLELWQNVAGVATDTGKKMPAASIVLQPAFAGRKNGWPDPFFRNFTISSGTQFGRTRWRSNTSGSSLPSATFSKITNAVFDGYALRRSGDLGSTSLNGPRIWFDEIGATTGDTVTVYSLYVSDGATVQCPLLFYNSSDVSVGVQQNPVNDTGGSTLAALSTTPKWLKHEVTIPSGAAYAAIYPYSTTATKNVDLIALWAFKGAASTGPQWPSMADPDGHGETLEDHETRLDDIEPIVEDNLGCVTFAVARTGVVSHSGTSTTLDGTSFSATARDLPFMGWGERYSPAGVSFNAIKVKSISRTVGTTAPWASLNVVIRTGANSYLAGSTIVAVGSIEVPEESDSLADVTILLKDPTTGAVKTLTNADFSGSEYFIGVYALTRDGSIAACGEPRGTMTNSLLQSYYTGGDPTTGAWTATTSGSNARLGFQHLLLTSPTESVDYAPTNALAQALAALGATAAPELVVPPYVYGVQGLECNVYVDNVFVADYADYIVDVAQSGNLGQQLNERWTYTPTGAVTSGTLTVGAHEKRTGTELVTATAQFRAAASTDGSGTTKKVLVIGDSLTDAGTITQNMLDIVTAGDAMALTLLGTRGSGSNKHEGRPGWTITAYTTNYSDVYGANPFWISGGVNFPQYLVNNAIATPDWVFIALGTNDCFGLATDTLAESTAASVFASLNTLVTSIKAAGVGVKVGLVLPPPPAYNQDSFGSNYGVQHSRWRHKRNVTIWVRELIEAYAGQEASRIYLVPSNVALDTIHNMPSSSVASNSRNSTLITRQDNGLHPSSTGYRQIGDAWWAFLKVNHAA